MDKIAGKITQAGLDALQNGEIDDPNMELMLEVIAQVGTMNRDNCIKICMQLCDEFGSVEMALFAVRNGHIGFTKVN